MATGADLRHSGDVGVGEVPLPNPLAISTCQRRISLHIHHIETFSLGAVRPYAAAFA